MIWGWCTELGQAQLYRATGPALLPASAYVNQDDAFSAEVNPALVALMPSFSLAYMHSELDRGASFMSRGDGLYAALPLAFGFATALSLHSVRPAERSMLRASRALAAATVSYAPSPRAAVGLTTRTVFSQDPRLDGLTAFDLGVVLRPSPVLQGSIAARDLFLSRSGFGLPGLPAAPALITGLQLRPFGTTAVVLDANFAIDTQSQTGLRLGAGVTVPTVGQLSVVGELQWPRQGAQQSALMAELTMGIDHLSLGGGILAGDDFGSGVHGYGFVRLDGGVRSGLTLDPSGRVLDVELKSLTPRQFLSTSQLLERAQRDPAIAGVLLRPRGSGLGLALAQELRLQLDTLRRAGKYTGCHLEEATGSEYYMCAGAEQVFVDPAGSIRLMGQSAQVMLFGESLKKIHVRAEFMRIGDQKSAPEQFTRSTMSEPAREQANALLDDAYARMVGDLAGDLHRTPEEVVDLMDAGPYLAQSGVEAGLVHGLLDRSEIGSDGPAKRLSELGLTREIEDRHPRHFGIASRVGLVLIDGTIIDGESVDIPLVGLHSSGGTTVVQAIDGLAADPTVRAIVVRVDSPGGSVLASDQIWRAIYRARQRKPVVASMGAVAASGGYYVASAAQEIWADPSTLTGSIGIFYGKVDVSALAERLGIGVEILERGEKAGANSLFRSLTTEERAALAERLRVYYRMFLERVATGRRMKVHEVDALGRGRVFSGDAAKRVKLVDHLGGVASALARARQLAHLSDDVEVATVPSRGGGILNLLLQGVSEPAVQQASVAMPESVRRAFAALISLQRLDGGEVLALLPYDLVF